MLNLIFIILFLGQSLYSEDFAGTYKSASTDDERIKILDDIEKDSSSKNAKIVLEALKKGESNKLRAKACEVLGTLKSGVDEIQKSYDSDDAVVRESCMLGLARISNAKSIPYFEKGIKDKNDAIKSYALRGLSAVGRSNHADLLVIGLKSSDSDDKEEALKGLTRLKSNDYWKKVSEFCDSKEEKFVVLCLNYFKETKIKEGLPSVEKNLSSTNASISTAAIEAIGAYGGNNTIESLIRFKNSSPNHPNIEEVSKMLKKLNSAKLYLIVKVADSLNLRSASNDRSSIVVSLKNGTVLAVLEKDPRKYEITDKKGNVTENFWYKVKTFTGSTGYVFGEFVEIVEAY
ncbi:MAG: SH3 domain-containing protein [Leptospiraceae bacterium]|nr:SH3 domain-containing protein [Leptospiraceae bacterium]